MKSLIIAAIASMVLFSMNTRALAEEPEKPYRPPSDRGMYGSGPGDMRPRAPKIEPREEPVTTAMDTQWKWLLGAVLIGFIGFTFWRLWSEASKVRPAKERKPWEIE